MLDTLARPDRRIDLGQVAVGRVHVQHQVADRDLAPEVDVREGALHAQRRVHRLGRTEMQEVDVGQFGLVRQVRGDADRQALRVRRPRRMVGVQAGERALLPNGGVEDDRQPQGE